MEGYTEFEVEKLHEQYWNLYEKEGFFFMGAIDVYVPMMVFWAGVSCVGKTELTVLEHFICRLIQEEIHDLNDIAFVLGVNERLIEKAVEQLVKSEILEKCTVCKEEKTWGRASRRCGSLTESMEYYLTTGGKELFLKNQKISVEREQIRSVFNMVSGNLEEEENLQLIQQVPEGHFILDAYYLLQHDDEETEKLLLSQFQLRFPQKNGFRDLSIGKKEVFYKKYHMMLYRMENRPKLRFVLYDFSKQLFDVTVSKKMQDMYENGKLSRMTQIISQAQDGIVILSDMERRLRIQPANIRYIMNREIRELVKSLFQIAQKSVFIVSPWINDSEYIMGKEFLEQMENTLKKDDFMVTIAYGYKSETEIKKLTDRMLNGKLKKTDKEFLENKKDIHSELAARRLQERFGNYSNFKMIFRNTHEKILCYDEKVSLVGSFNYFSYDGGESCNYEGSFFRKEGAALIEDEKFAKELIRIILKQE